VSRRRALGAAATLAVVVALGWTLADGWSTVTAHDWELRPGWLVGAAVLLTLGYGLAAEAYALVVGELHPEAVAARAALRRQWTVSILGRYVPGNVLMVAGRMELARGTGVPRRVALAASTYEQILMLGASALGALAFVAYYGDLGRGGAIWLVAAVPLLFVLLHPTVMQRASGWALRKVGREPLTSVLTGRQATGLFLLYALVQALVGLATWMIVRGTAGPAGDALWGTLAYQLAFTLSMLAFIFPAGLGVRDGVLALALAQELPTEVAVAAAVLVRLAMTMFEIAFVAVVSALGRRR
jgi:hypothetical protein